MPRKVEISHKTIIFTVVFLASIWFVYYVRDIVLQLFMALLVMTILNPFVKKLSQYRIPKAVSVLIAYIFSFGLFSIVIASILPALIEQTTNLANNLPNYLQNLGLNNVANEEVLKQVVSQLGSVPGKVVVAGVSLFGNILDILTVAIFAFYLLLMRDKFDENLEFLFGKEKTRYVSDMINTLEIKLGGWARGQLSLMLLIGVFSYIGFIILGIPYALPLALLSGIFEIVPYIGPVIAAIPAIILGFSISPFLGFAAIGLAILIQQLENYVFVPKIMEKSTGVSPIITLLSLAIGFKVAGIVGMIICVPIVIILQTLLQTKFEKSA